MQVHGLGAGGDGAARGDRELRRGDRHRRMAGRLATTVEIHTLIRLSTPSACGPGPVAGKARSP